MTKKNTGMFKSYDIRTKHENITDKEVVRLAEAISLYFKDSLKVTSAVICRDTRLYVPQFAEQVCNILLKNGLDVFLNPQPVSTCQFYYTCMKHRKSAGLMFTASHNPGSYVGIKIVSQDVVPVSMESGPEGGLSKIREFYTKGEKPEKPAAPGKMTVVNELDSYIDYSMRLAGVQEGSLKGLKVMLECLNGSVGFEMALAFQKAGATVSCRHLIPNGFFPCGDPNPIIESSIAPARKAMKDGKFDIGFCFDGDGDRMDIMDSDGNQIVPSHNMSIIAPYIKKELFNDEKKNIYTDLKALPSSLIEIAQAGITPHTGRNGHSFIKVKLRESFRKGFFAAVEESAHYYICLPFDPNKITNRITDFAITESSMFYALLTARCCKEKPQLYKPAKETAFREREWSIHTEKNPKALRQIVCEVEKQLSEDGAEICRTMEDGTDLDATMIKFNLPDVFTENTSIEGKKWYQVMLRESRSEDNLLRIEVSSYSKKKCKEIKSLIDNISDRYI